MTYSKITFSIFDSFCYIFFQEYIRRSVWYYNNLPLQCKWITSLKNRKLFTTKQCNKNSFVLLKTLMECRFLLDFEWKPKKLIFFFKTLFPFHVWVPWETDHNASTRLPWYRVSWPFSGSANHFLHIPH
jgi:hypothetical protein